MINERKIVQMSAETIRGALGNLTDDINYYLSEREKPGRKMSDLDAEMFTKWGSYCQDCDLRNLLRLQEYLTTKLSLAIQGGRAFGSSGA